MNFLISFLTTNLNHSLNIISNMDMGRLRWLGPRSNCRRYRGLPMVAWLTVITNHPPKPEISFCSQRCMVERLPGDSWSCSTCRSLPSSASRPVHRWLQKNLRLRWWLVITVNQATMGSPRYRRQLLWDLVIEGAPCPCRNYV